MGFAARPVGAAIFGHWGDRIGRKATLITTLLVMGISTALVGLLPGTEKIGALAPILLVLLRLLQGLAVGGEWSGSVLLSMEWGDQKRRGLMASLPQLGVAFGLILGTGFLYLLSWRLTDEQFQSWGWRIPFVFSLVMVAIGLYIRMRILETPMFARRLQKKQISRLPTVDAIRSHWKPILLSALARLSEQAPFYVITSFTLVYLTEEEGYTKTFALAAILSAAALEVIAVPLFGHLSDSIGRKKIYMTGAALTGSVRLRDVRGDGQRDRGDRLLRRLPGADPPRHAVRTAGLADRRVVPDLAALRRRRDGLPARLGHRRWPGTAGRDVPAGPHGSGYSIAFAILGCAIVTLIAVALMDDHSRSDIDDDASFGAVPEPVETREHVTSGRSV